MVSLILDNMQFAERIGQKYAHRNGRHVDEAVAEAYFCLVSFFLIDSHLYKPDKYKGTLGIYIKRALIKYFERQVQRPDVLKETIIKNTDEEMIEFLSGLMPDDKAFKIFDLLRGGVNLYEIDIVDPELMKVAKKLRLQVASRIRRISELKAAGIKVSREIEYVNKVEDEWCDNIVENNPGIPGRNTDSGDDSGKQDQSEARTTLAA